MVKVFIGVLVGAAIVAGGWWYFADTQGNSPAPAQEETMPQAVAPKPKPGVPSASIGDENLVEFTCAERKTITAVFTRDIVGLTLSDGRQIELRQAESASGIRYVNNTESIEFRSKGEEAFLEEGGKITYTDCSAS